MKYQAVTESVHIPQKPYLKGDHIFNMVMDDPLLPKRTDVKDLPWADPIRTWMVSCPPAWIRTGYTGNFYKMKEKGKLFNPRVEILLGNLIHDHNIVHLARGTQPFGSYLRGHINSGRDRPDLFPMRTYDFIDIQHYYVSDKVSGDFTEDQVYMTYMGLRVLSEEGFIGENDPVLCFDKSYPPEKYLGEDVFLTPSVGTILKFWENISYEEALLKWRRFAEYGKNYEDESVALNFLKV